MTGQAQGKCVVEQFSSRACERGTKGCEVQHVSSAATRHLMQAEKDMEAVILTGAGDREAAHGEADAILCRALKLLGYRRLVDLYEKVPKWYA